MPKNKRQVIGDVSGKVLGMYGDLSEKLRSGNITLREFELFLNRKNPFVTPGDIREEWQEFYTRVLGLTVDLSEVKIPDDEPGFDRVLLIPEGLTMNQVITACRKRFKVYTYVDDLDRDVPTNDRSPKSGAYAIRLRDRREADEELKNLSANALSERNIKGITLLERLVLELKHHYETGEHLDVENVTLCSGSRHSGGYVPRVYWYDGRLCVDWYHPGDAYGYLRSRAAVS